MRLNMDFQGYLDQRNISKYQLSKISGVPKTTIMDICSGRSAIERCSAKTVQQLAKALNCTMEDIMQFSAHYDPEKGVPQDESYFEKNLPPFLKSSIENMKKAQQKIADGEDYYLWDCDFCDLQSSINQAEACQFISPDQAWYLREKYLDLERV